MKLAEITKENMKEIQVRAAKRAVRENKALGLKYRKIENNVLVEVLADGSVAVIGAPKFAMVKVAQRSFKLKKG